MNRSELTASIAGKITEMPKSKVRHGVDTIFDIIKASLVKGQRLEVRGFGSMCVKEYEPRKGRNPKTGEEVQVGKKYRVKYRQSDFFKKALNA